MYTQKLLMEVNGYTRTTLVEFLIDDEGIQIQAVHVDGRVAVPHFSPKGEFLGVYPRSVDVLPILGDDELRFIEDEIRTALALRSFDDAAELAA